MPKLLLASIALGIVFVGSSAHAADITACGQTVGTRDIGVLQNDLTCMGPSSVAFRLESGAVLDLGGHALTLTTSTPIAVECLGRCSVLGPGTLATTGAGPFGV